MTENKKFDLFEGIEISEKERPMVERINKVSDIIFKIVKTRLDLNISQRELANKTGIKQPVIARIEKLTSIPRIDTLCKICDALNIELNIEIKEEPKEVNETSIVVKQEANNYIEYCFENCCSNLNNERYICENRVC